MEQSANSFAIRQSKYFEKVFGRFTKWYNVYYLDPPNNPVEQAITEPAERLILNRVDREDFNKKIVEEAFEEYYSDSEAKGDWKKVYAKLSKESVERFSRFLRPNQIRGRFQNNRHKYR